MSRVGAGLVRVGPGCQPSGGQAGRRAGGTLGLTQWKKKPQLGRQAGPLPSFSMEEGGGQGVIKGGPGLPGELEALLPGTAPAPQVI